MGKRLSISVAAAAVLALQGCAIVRSVPARDGGEGIAYMLPRALLPVELVHDGSAFELRISSPVMVGDAAHTYALQRSSNVFSSDHYVVNVDSATGLLTAVNLTSEDQTIPVIAKLAGRLKAEGADAVTTVVVFRELFDPGWDGKAVESFNQRLSHAARTHVARLKKENTCEATPMPDACKAVNALSDDLAATAFAVGVEGAEGKPREPADCSAGFCYRINVPHVVTLSGPGTRNSAVFGLPNRSPTFVIPLERWAFVKTTHDVALDNGVFKSITTDRPSSALAVASAPLDIAKAALGAVGEVLQLKIDLSGKEKSLADAKVAEIAAKAALEKALLDKAGGKAEAAILGAKPEREGPLLSIRVGQAGQLDATKNLVGVKAAPPKPSATTNPDEAKSGFGGTTNSGSAGSPGTGKN